MNRHLLINWLADNKLYVTSTIRVPANTTGTICGRNQTATLRAFFPPEVAVEWQHVGLHVHKIPVPDACTTVEENVTTAKTTFEEEKGWETEVGSSCSDVDIYLSSATFKVEKDYFLGLAGLPVLFFIKIDWKAEFETKDGFENAGVQWRFSNANYWPWADALEEYSKLSIRPADAQSPLKPECSGENERKFYKAGTPFPYQSVSKQMYIRSTHTYIHTY